MTDEAITYLQGENTIMTRDTDTTYPVPALSIRQRREVEGQDTLNPFDRVFVVNPYDRDGNPDHSISVDLRDAKRGTVIRSGSGTVVVGGWYDVQLEIEVDDNGDEWVELVYAENLPCEVYSWCMGHAAIDHIVNEAESLASHSSEAATLQRFDVPVVEGGSGPDALTVNVEETPKAGRFAYVTLRVEETYTFENAAELGRQLVQAGEKLQAWAAQQIEETAR
jgi:hypothetical protein